MSVRDNLLSVKKTIPTQVKLIAVSKTKPADAIMEAYQSGQRIFGENRAQEMTEKSKLLPNDIQWHFIGHLQTNKIKYMASFVSMIHSVDSFRLLKEINVEAEKCSRTIDCLLQFFIATEETKFGFNLIEARQMLASNEYKKLQNIKLCGVMGMATFTNDLEQVHAEFRSLKNYFNLLKNEHFQNEKHFNELSMGMSDDYQIAISEGSTMVRIGSAIFGQR